MKLTFSIDTDDLYGEEGMIPFERLFTTELRKEITRSAKNKVATDKFREFTELTSEAIVTDVKRRMIGFLSEEIVITGRYGEKNFVGSIEDLIKMRFDDVLLRPVDDRGETLHGCTSSGKTWIEWSIQNQLGDKMKRIVKDASSQVEKEITASINKKLLELKDSAIKEHVDKAWLSLFQKQG